jgi:hypothetical protein
MPRQRKLSIAGELRNPGLRCASRLRLRSVRNEPGRRATGKLLTRDEAAHCGQHRQAVGAAASTLGGDRIEGIPPPLWTRLSAANLLIRRKEKEMQVEIEYCGM